MSRMAQARQVVVTGMGIVSPLGVGMKNVWPRLTAGQSGIVSLNDTVLKHHPDIPCRVGGAVPKNGTYASNGAWDPLDWAEKGALRRIPEFAQYALAAAQQALIDARWFPDYEAEKVRTGVCVGSGIGGFDDVYQNVTAFNEGGYRKVGPLFIPRLLTNMAAGHISITFGLKGPNASPASACTTGAHAIGDAANLIQLGMADVMVAGSAEASLHPVALAGFSRAKSLATGFNDSPEQASRPFDKDRKGFVMGEGAGIVVLEELNHALNRGARIYAEVVGYGMSGDAHHITAPSESGDGAKRSMQMAIDRSGIRPCQIDYVNAHATSTKLGDAAENRAICEVLAGTEAEREKDVHGWFKKSASEINVSSTKSSTGHLLGGAGSVEALFTIKALDTDTLPPTLNLDHPDEGFECNYVSKVSQNGIDIGRPLEYAMTNSFGFGGTNASLLFRKYRE